MTKLICPKCEVEMTHHASKVIAPRGDSRKLDSELGGVVVERHQCPLCGGSGTTFPASIEKE
jgi:ribosomal protein S27AE